MPDIRPLLVVEPSRDQEEACCAECAAGSVPSSAGPGPRLATTLPVLQPARPAMRRDADRTIAGVGLGIAAVFVAAGLLTSLAAALSGGTTWLPLHLVLAGAAGTAIAGVLPFFSAALAVAPPADPRLRLTAVGTVALGALFIVASIAAGRPSLGHVGGSVYLVGVVLAGIAGYRPLRGALGPRRRLLERASLAALAAALVGVLLVTAMLAGWAPVVERWAMLKPAHVWLNLIGSLSVIIVTTLTHLAPTIEGTRMRPRATASVALVGLTIGSSAVALGYAFALDPLARLGAVGALIGAAAVLVHTLAVRSSDDPWTTDVAWHRFAIWSLRLGSAWFLGGMVVLAGRVLWLGADPAALSLTAIGIPFVMGWVLQVLVGSWSHLIPALGPGDPGVRARRREWLSRAAMPRLMALNAGTLAAWFGVWLGVPVLLVVGALGVGLALAASGALAAVAAHGRAVLAVAN